LLTFFSADAFGISVCDGVVGGVAVVLVFPADVASGSVCAVVVTVALVFPAGVANRSIVAVA